MAIIGITPPCRKQQQDQYPFGVRGRNRRSIALGDKRQARACTLYTVHSGRAAQKPLVLVEELHAYAVHHGAHTLTLTFLPVLRPWPAPTSSCGLSPNIMLNATLALGMSAMSGGIPGGGGEPETQNKQTHTRVPCQTRTGREEKQTKKRRERQDNPGGPREMSSPVFPHKREQRTRPSAHACVAGLAHRLLQPTSPALEMRRGNDKT